MSALVLLFIPFLLLLRKVKPDTHPLGLLTKLLNKFHECFCMTKQLLLEQPSLLMFACYLTLDFWWSLKQWSSHQGTKLKLILRWEKIHPILVALDQRNTSALLHKAHRALAREWHWSGTHQYLLPKVQAASISQSNRAAGQRPTLALFHINMQRNYSWWLPPSIEPVPHPTQSKAESE